jgi:predicted small metal-binding protein
MKTDMSLEKESAEVESVDLRIEELEPIVAPIVKWNHNETAVPDEEILLEIEELEPIVAPGVKYNHNETVIHDEEIQ